MNDARGCAFVVVRRVFERGAYADRAFAAEARDLAPRERALAQAIAYGTVQRRLTLDHLAEGLTGRSLRRLEPAVRAALRIGLFQLLYLDGVAPHAAVAETVELVKPVSPRGARLVNAVLRRAAGQGQVLLEGFHDRDPAGASLLHSVPAWLSEMWFAELGSEPARALLAQINRPAESALRVNTLCISVEAAVRALPVSSHPAPRVPEGLVLEAPFDAHGSVLWGQGAIMPQSRGSMQVARVVDPGPGERVLDLCAAPGGKTTHLAALAEDQGEIVAVERHLGRARVLESTCRRMRAGSVRVVVGDAAAWAAAERFDRVLVDPPCSGLGTLQSRPDLRWRMTPQAIGELAGQQLAILRAAAQATRPGGSLTYSVCTISRAESNDVVARFLAEHSAFALEESLQLLPHSDGTDGFFIARLRREAD